MKTPMSNLSGVGRTSSSSSNSNDSTSQDGGSYPMACYLNFCPGGMEYSQEEEEEGKEGEEKEDEEQKLDDEKKKRKNHHERRRNNNDYLHDLSKYTISDVRAEALIQNALEADSLLSLSTSKTSSDVHYLPSLSLLMEAVLGPLTGVSAEHVRKWVDAIVLAYDEDSNSCSHDDVVSWLKSSSTVVSGDGMHRPCGYVFKRGDIAWNCRTCQTDSTCVLCDDCFRHSDHEGHEVFFHRTQPGGCCDCGDTEAWNIRGCCPKHTPQSSTNNNNTSTTTPLTCIPIQSTSNDLEAVKLSESARKDGEKLVKEAFGGTRIGSALAVVIGAAVQCIVRAVDGSGWGCDLVQWKRRWADEVRKIRDGVPHDDDYSTLPSNRTSSAKSIPSARALTFPTNFKLHLRLHNDDVHTFDEVIDALHTRPSYHTRNNSNNNNNNNNNNPEDVSLVVSQSQAEQMTHHVDKDGQVTVKSYSTFAGAISGFTKLKSKGLHCAVVSTPQCDLEKRARKLLQWLSDICAAHPAASALVVHALSNGDDDSAPFGGLHVWTYARMIPPWSNSERRLQVFPPHLPSSYLTREEAFKLYQLGLTTTTTTTTNNDSSSSLRTATEFLHHTGASANFYAKVPYHLPSERFRKSPHALWGTFPPPKPVSTTPPHPTLATKATTSGDWNWLTDPLLVLDTDLRKQQEWEETLTKANYPHLLLGLYLVSGVGLVPEEGEEFLAPRMEEWRHLLSASSFRAPISPLMILLLMDPYPTKQLRLAIHNLFLSLLIDARFKSRFAATLGGVAYRPLSTLFCAGVGTEADTPLSFTVQIFTAGSLVRALCSPTAMKQLLSHDSTNNNNNNNFMDDVYTIPIAHTVVRCIHTNLLGATKEVQMVLKHTADSRLQKHKNINDRLTSALTYQMGENPLLTLLPAAPDDQYLDSKSTRHKRLPHLYRDLEYIFETPGTALRLLSSQTEDHSSFIPVWCRLLRLTQGMDPLKRKINGGHVEFEQNRWLEAFGLSLNITSARDALAESQSSSSSSHNNIPPSMEVMRQATGNLFAGMLREMKWWLYREGLLDTGFPVSGGTGAGEMGLMEALQRSTLHVSNDFSVEDDDMAGSNGMALSCATGVKMTEPQLSLIENALKSEKSGETFHRGDIMGDWLRVPHSPLSGDSLSFHLPLHRAFARSIRSICSVVVTQSARETNPDSWWKLPLLDEDGTATSLLGVPQHRLSTLLQSTLKPGNCRIVWSAGLECNSSEAQMRRSRARSASAGIAAAKIIHSLCDHPLRCLVAAQQVERHIWVRNGSAAAGMALNYGTVPLCRSFRDLDLTMVQFSAAGLNMGLGARRVFALIVSRFSMDGYLCDPEKRCSVAIVRSSSGGISPTNSYGGIGWVNPPRLLDPDHAVALSESFFATICLLVTELPSPPPLTYSDDSVLRQRVRRELLHALAAEPRSHSEAMTAAAAAVTRRDESDGSSSGVGGGAASFRMVFTDVLKNIAISKNKGSRATSSAPLFQLKVECSDEYDPTFFHLRRNEHQHAMDTIARLRRQKLHGTSGSNNNAKCLPLVTSPPLAHPRFLPCRLLLHLPAMDAAIRRMLLFAIFNGKWLPPPEPSTDDSDGEDELAIRAGSNLTDKARSRMFPKNSSGGPKGRPNTNNAPPFSPDTISGSSISLIEVLQLLTLQVHTLEECASIHRSQHTIDDESKSLSAEISINSYLGRLIHVPHSLIDVWALKCPPEGPLPSKGSGKNRGSVLGLLVALYENRSVSGDGSGGNNDSRNVDDGQGGARTLAADGLKWLLRFVNSLVDGAPSVGTAHQSATNGIRYRKTSSSEVTTSWSIDPNVQSTVSGMLCNLPDLWPQDVKAPSPEKAEISAKAREARKAAQMRAMARMKAQQASFAKTLSLKSDGKGFAAKSDSDEEVDLCIICKCDDADGENNGPLGYLGHVQRSRTTHLSASGMGNNLKNDVLSLSYRVVGEKGCQLREHENMDSAEVACLPRGSIVTLKEKTIVQNYGLLSRRVLVQYLSPNDGKKVEGWANIQSSQGYTILQPLSPMCYRNSRWGCTRPIVMLCGHTAHLRCVEKHCLSLHQRSASDQPYDGRFAANIDDGEFLCPLCKQLSNVLVPSGGSSVEPNDESSEGKKQDENAMPLRPASDKSLSLSYIFKKKDVKKTIDENRRKAIMQYGAQLLQSMQIPLDKNDVSKKRKKWHPMLLKWDFEETMDSESDKFIPKTNYVGSSLRFLRQLHIAFAAVGHSASSMEALSRNESVSDPWVDYDSLNPDTHPMMIELRRIIIATSSLQEVLDAEIIKELNQESNEKKSNQRSKSCLGAFLSNILDGHFWTTCDFNEESKALTSSLKEWSILTSLLAATPCHVARDGMLSQKNEARSTAAAIWTTKMSESTLMSFSMPSSLRKKISVKKSLGSPWGTMNPMKVFDDNDFPLVRPILASGYLYIPLLAWDLNNFAGAIFPALLMYEANAIEMLTVTRILLVARLVQALVTPSGLDTKNFSPLENMVSDENEVENKSLILLIDYCRNKVGLESSCFDSNSDKLTGAVSFAILPFGRSLVLILRACLSSLRQRKYKSSKMNDDNQSCKSNVEALVESDEIMFVEEGTSLLNMLGGPTLTFLSNALTGKDSSELAEAWKKKVDRWLIAVRTLESYHGSSESTLVFDTDKKEWALSKNFDSSKPVSDLQNENSPLKEQPKETTEDRGLIVEQTTVQSASGDSNANVECDGDLPTNQSIDMEDIDFSDDATIQHNNVDESQYSELDEVDMEEESDSDQAPTGLGGEQGLNIDIDGLRQNDIVIEHNGIVIEGVSIENEDDDSEDEEMEDVGGIFDLDQVINLGLAQRPGIHIDQDNQSDAASEESSTCSIDSPRNFKQNKLKNEMFANVSNSPIIPYQPSLLGNKEIGPGSRGFVFDTKTASNRMHDLSHLGVIHYPEISPGLIRLPNSFVELYSYVNKIRGGDTNGSLDESEESSSSETAICLITGKVMRSGSLRSSYPRVSRSPGACTVHAREYGSGIGIFFLLQKCTVLLMHNNKSAYSASLYVDENGEEDPGLRRGRPLFLKNDRYKNLENLLYRHKIPREVAQIRSTSDRVIRDNWY